MAKRFAAILLITIGIVLASTFVLLLVLFLAPGLSILGVKYIATGTHVVHVSNSFSELFTGSNVYSSIRVEVDDVPISVVFSQDYIYAVDYYDNFNGLTTSKMEDPSAAFSRESDGTVVIKVNSFKKLLYENANSKRYIRLLIPASEIGSSRKGQIDLTIKSKNSTVHFYDEKDDNFDPEFKNLTIETAGKVTSSTNVTAKDYTLTTLNAIQIGEDPVSSINATNYYLTSTGGRIVVDREVNGKIVAKTKNARIQILKCVNFEADSGFGDIYSSRKDVDIEISGVATINTTAGVVDIGQILSTSSKSKITTKTGTVRVKKVYDLDVSTTRGFVRVDSGRKLNITTSSGDVFVDEATSSVKVVTTRGTVNLGSGTGEICNPTVESVYGNVNIFSASGTVKTEITKGKMELYGGNLAKTTLNIGGSLTVKNLSGEVDIEVNGDADISYKSFTDKSTITGTKAGSTILINMVSNQITTFSYSLDGNDVSLFEYNEDDPNNSPQMGKSTSLVGGTTGRPKLSVKSEGRVLIYYKG